MRTLIKSPLFERIPTLAVTMLCSLLMLSACSSGPPPKLYLLDSIEADTQTIELVRTSVMKSLGMSPVQLPDYSADTRIASLGNDGTVYLDDGNRWAEEPKDAITRLLSDRLRAHSEGTVLVEPWPRDYEPVARVEVSFDKLLRQPDGGAHMTGKILLLSGSGRKLLNAVPFNISHAGSNTDSRAFFIAVAKGVDDIANIAVAEIRAFGIKS